MEWVIIQMTFACAVSVAGVALAIGDFSTIITQKAEILMSDSRV